MIPLTEVIPLTEATPLTEANSPVEVVPLTELNSSAEASSSAGSITLESARVYRDRTEALFHVTLRRADDSTTPAHLYQLKLGALTQRERSSLKLLAPGAGVLHVAWADGVVERPQVSRASRQARGAKKRYNDAESSPKARSQDVLSETRVDTSLKAYASRDAVESLSALDSTTPTLVTSASPPTSVRLNTRDLEGSQVHITPRSRRECSLWGRLVAELHTLRAQIERAARPQSLKALQRVLKVEEQLRALELTWRERCSPQEDSPSIVMDRSLARDGSRSVEDKARNWAENRAESRAESRAEDHIKLKAETHRGLSSQPDTPRSDTPRSDTPRSDTPRSDTPQSQADLGEARAHKERRESVLCLYIDPSSLQHKDNVRKANAPAREGVSELVRDNQDTPRSVDPSSGWLSSEPPSIFDLSLDLSPDLSDYQERDAYESGRAPAPINAHDDSAPSAWRDSESPSHNTKNDEDDARADASSEVALGASPELTPELQDHLTSDPPLEMWLRITLEDTYWRPTVSLFLNGERGRVTLTAQLISQGLKRLFDAASETLVFSESRSVLVEWYDEYLSRPYSEPEVGQS